MHRYLRLVLGIAIAASVHGCVGLGAWTLGTRTESSAHPKIEQVRGTIKVHKEGTDTDLKTAKELRTQWGEPDHIELRDDGKEEWIYRTGGLRWTGMVLYLVILPLPAMVPIGSQSVSFVVHEGRIEQATQKDWAFKGGAYCGYFGMMYGRLSCGTGTFEETQGGTE